MTDSGKSTLMQVLMTKYQNQYSSQKFPVKTLIVDTKPRFKAAMELNGLSTLMTGRYKKWGIIGSDIIHGSYILPRRDSPKKEIDQAWKLGGHTCIVQSESKSEWPDLV